MKRVNISIIIFLLYFVNIFAVNFETGLYGSAGIQYNIVKKMKDTYIKTKGFIGGEFGILGNIGINFDISNDTLKTISALIDFGYCKTSFSMQEIPYLDTENRYTLTFFDTINLGFLGKLNFNNSFSLGIGAGVMFPFSGFTVNSQSDDIDRFSKAEIKNNYTNPVMPYIKLIFECKKHLNEKLLFIYGLSLSYNFGMEYKQFVTTVVVAPPITENTTIRSYNIYEKEKISYINISIFAGVSFGRTE